MLINVYPEGIPDVGSYVAFKRAVLETCLRLPSLGLWRRSHTSQGYYEDIEVVEVNLKPCAAKAEIVVRKPGQQALKEMWFTGAEWQFMDVEPIKTS